MRPFRPTVCAALLLLAVVIALWLASPVQGGMFQSPISRISPPESPISPISPIESSTGGIWAMGEPTEAPTATPTPKAEHHHHEPTPAPATRLPSEDLFVCIGFPSGRVLCMGSWWK